LIKKTTFVGTASGDDKIGVVAIKTFNARLSSLLSVSIGAHSTLCGRIPWYLDRLGIHESNRPSSQLCHTTTTTLRGN
jgi:hypothetical protein